MPPETQGIVVIDGHICESSWIANKVTVGRYGADFNVIQDAIDYCDNQTGDWVIQLWPGRYDEIDITPNGGANITIKAMGEGRVVIWPTGDPVAAVIVSGFTLNLEDVDVSAFSAGFPAVRVTGGTLEATGAIIQGVGAGDAVQQVGGTVHLHDTEVPVGDIDLSTGACTLTLTDCNINGTLDTAGAVIHTVTARHSDFNDQAFNLAATGACVYHFESCNHIGTITDASLGAGVVNGHLCRCHVTGVGLVKNGTTGWLIDNSELTAISNTNAVGVISMYGGIVLAFTACTGVILWYEGSAFLKVLPTGTIDNINIQAAIDALPATGGEVFLLEGTYNIEVSLVLDSYQTLRGCGRNTILTTTTADLDIIIATGGSGSEKVGILIADLCIDGDNIAEAGIWWTYVDYSKIRDIWVYSCPSLVGIWLTTSDFNEIIGNTSKDSYWGMYIAGSSSNIFLGNTCQGNIDNGMGLTSLSNNNNISGNTCQGNGRHGIELVLSSGNTISGNTCQGNVQHGIYLGSGSDSTISGNTCQGNARHGIYTLNELGNTISGNICQENGQIGIFVKGSSGHVVSGNTCQWNRIGIELETSTNNTISGNNCQGNSWDNDNTYDNILLLGSDYNLIADNLCRAPTIGTTLTALEPIGETEIAVTDTAGFAVGMGVVIDLGGVSVEYHRISAITAGAPGVITIDAGLTNAQIAGETIDVPEARYGINIFDAPSENNIVKNNSLYDGGKTAAFNDAGTDTHLAAYVVPFSHGSDPQDSGFEIDIGGEFARAWLRLPIEVQQVVRMKIYARAVILSAAAMRLEINVNGGADNEAFNTHATAAPNTPSTSTNFAADDVIFWTLATAQIIALIGGDSVEVKVLHEAAGNEEVVTDAFFRTVEFEYV